MIAIAHKSSERDWLTPCVDSLRRYMPDEPFTFCVTPHYETGAWWQAWKDHPDAERFYFLHDSCVLQGTPPFYAPVTIVGSMDNYEGCSPEHIAWIRKTVEPFGVDPDVSFTAVHGSMFFCTREVMDALAADGWDKILPTNKFESQCMERVWGLAFKAAGIDPVCLGRGEDCYTDEAAVRKFPGGRP